MNFSEFIRQLGTEPANRAPSFLRARESSPEFIQAAAESDRFESHLSRALAVDVPADMLASLKEIANSDRTPVTPWRNYALAAGLLMAVTVTGITWRANMSYDSVEQYVALHYAHDGPALLANGTGQLANNVDEILRRFQVELTPEAKQMVGLIRICRTPDGNGAHMVLNTNLGPITVIFMPETVVADKEMLDFDGMQAQLVTLAQGSAAVIGAPDQQIASLYTLVQSSFVPLGAEA